jgi:hypothetical protein
MDSNLAMKKIISFLRNCFFALLYPRPLIGIFYLPRFFIEFIKYKKSGCNENISLKDFHPCLLDWVIKTPFDAHYFYQGAWLARKVKQKAILPSMHFDIGSSVLTLSVLSAFVNITFIDYRPLDVEIDGLNCMSGDVLNLQFESNSIDSLSCLHVLEHIGLGRYGDSIDAFGSEKAAKELTRVLAAGGSLFLSVPIGRNRVCFNAHRVFSAQSVINMFKELTLVEFSCINDEGQILHDQNIEVVLGYEYGCGLFHFIK